MTQSIRYVGLDVHKHYVMVGAVDQTQQTVLPPRKVAMAELEGWAEKYLRPTDHVVLEATTNAWYVHDLLEPLVERVVVAHPPQVKLIAAAMVKTDKKDTMTLAKLLAVNLIPAVWLPPVHVRDLRALLAHRRRLVSQQTRCKNRLQSVLHRHHIVPPTTRKLYHPDQHPWWLGLDLAAGDKLRVRQELMMIDQLDTLIDETSDELYRLSLSDPWREQLPYLIQLPGIGALTAMVILSAVGDIQRFPSAKKLVGYAGLGARIHASGLTFRTGGITKQGRRELRTALIEAAWVTVRVDATWREQFERLEQRIGRRKAIVAIARKLLVVVWHVLFHRRVDRQADPERVVRYLLAWGRQARVFTRSGLKAPAFARQQLDILGIGQELPTLINFGVTYRLPPSSLPLTAEAHSPACT
jgi:transposase